MIVSTKGRYALRVMIDLAENQSEKYIPLKAIAARQGISEKYLENILKTLVQHGLLQGLRGKGGGYRLTRPAANYRISDILLLTEARLRGWPSGGRGAAGAARRSGCRTCQLWRGLDEVIRPYLAQITRAALARPAQSGDHYMI